MVDVAALGLSFVPDERFGPKTVSIDQTVTTKCLKASR